jgi:hypothetical protein
MRLNGWQRGAAVALAAWWAYTGSTAYGAWQVKQSAENGIAFWEEQRKSGDQVWNGDGLTWVPGEIEKENSRALDADFSMERATKRAYTVPLAVVFVFFVGRWIFAGFRRREGK